MSRSRATSKRSAARRTARPAGRGRGLQLLLLLFLFALAYLWGRERTLEEAGWIEGLRVQRESLQRQVDRLELEMADQRGSGHVVEEALKLGLVFPASPMETIAVAPAAAGPRPTVWTYLRNAAVMAAEGLERELSPRAWAREVLTDSSRADRSGDRPVPPDPPGRR
jgi:hypothetical protein